MMPLSEPQSIVMRIDFDKLEKPGEEDAAQQK